MRNLLILFAILSSNIQLSQEQSIEKILKAHFTNLNHIEWVVTRKRFHQNPIFSEDVLA